MGVLGVYCRISNKRDNYSLGEQKRMGIEVCEKNGYDYKVYEEVKSGTKGIVGRRLFKEMMNLVEDGKLDGVVIYNVDRFLRDKRVSIEIEDIYEELEGFEFFVDGDKRQIGEYEKDKDWWEFEVSRSSSEIRSMRRKFLVGLKKSYRDGISVGGGKKYGYDRIKDKRSEKRIIINEKEKEIILEVHKILNSKRNIKSLVGVREKIYEKFNVNLYSAKLNRIISDKTYFTGIWVFNFMEEEYKFSVDKILEEEIYDNSNKIYKHLKGLRKGRDKKDYLLKGLVYCGECGEKSYIIGSGKENKDYRYFSCSSFVYTDRVKLLKKGGCNCYKKNTINMKFLDNAVWEVLFKVLGSVDIIKEEYLKKFDKGVGENRKFKGRLKYGEDKLKELESEEIEVITNLGKSGIDKKRLDLITSEFDKKRTKVLEDIRRYKKEYKKYEDKEVVSDYLDLMKTDLERRKNVGVKNRKDEIRRYIERVCIKRINENEYNLDLKFKIDINKDELDKFVEDVIREGNINLYIKFNRIYMVNSYIERISIDISCNILIMKYIKGRYNYCDYFKIEDLGFDIK